MHTQARHTAGTLAALLTAGIEPQTAEVVLASLRKIDGQLITTRLLDKLPGGRIEWRLSRNYGWTEIKNAAYVRTQGESHDGVTLMLARSEASVPLDAAWVEQHNPAYFAGRRERNAQRAKAIKDTALLDRIAAAMNVVEEALYKLDEAKREFSAFTEAPPCSVAKYELERACGLREKGK